MMLAQIRKLIVAVLGLLAILLNQHLGVDVTGMTDQAADAVISVLTAIGVWWIPNQTA